MEFLTVDVPHAQRRKLSTQLPIVPTAVQIGTRLVLIVQVNRRTGKSQFDCARVDERWLTGCDKDDDV